MFYRFARWLFSLVFRYLCHWTVEGKENLPTQGPVIIVANHVSNWDPIVVGVALDRQVHFMAKEELFRVPVFRWILVALGAFSVDRSRGDLGAIKTALRLLLQGKVVGMFPEGKRNRSQDLLLPFQSGVALLALKTKAPVIPVGINGSRRIFYRGWFRPFTVRIGPPVKLPDIVGRKPSAGELATAVQSMEQAVSSLIGLKPSEKSPNVGTFSDSK